MWTHFQGEEARKSPASRAKKRLSSSLSSKRGSGENFLLERKNLKWDSGGLNNELNWDRWLWIRLERKFRLSIRPHSERPNLGESLTKSLWRPSRHLLCWPYLLSLASAAWIKEDGSTQRKASLPALRHYMPTNLADTLVMPKSYWALIPKKQPTR